LIDLRCNQCLIARRAGHRRSAAALGCTESVAMTETWKRQRPRNGNLLVLKFLVALPNA